MSLREVIERIRSSPTPPNEETAKIKILLPILNELSWDPNGQEVLLEHPVGGKKAGGKADIALQADGHIRAIIEAKAPGTSLQQHVEQVMIYAYYEGVGICVLSDGLQWWLYHPQHGHEHGRFAELRLGDQGDPIEQICNDLSTFLGRESLLSGQAVNQATQVLKARQEAAQLGKEIPKIWQGMLDEPDDELIELVVQRVYDKLSLRPSREQIIATLRNRPVPPKPEAPGIQEPAPPPASIPTAVVLLGERHPIRLHSDILMTVVEELYKRYPDRFDETVEPLKFRKWQYVSRDRRRVAGKKPKQTPSGYFVNVILSAERQRRRWTQLLEAFGHQESDLQLLYEESPSEKPSIARPTPRPTAIRLWDQPHPVKAHYEILMTVVEELYRRHGHRFETAVTELRSGDYKHASRDPARVRPQRVKQTPSGMYVDVNVSARDVKKRAARLLEALGHNESDLVYLYE